MNKRRITIISLIGGGLLMLGLAIAKGLHAAHGGYRGHHGGKIGMLCSGDRITKLDQMTRHITDRLNLTADQSTKWGAVTAVIQAGDFQTLCNLKSNDSVIATNKLKQMELAMTEGLNTIKKVQAPFNSFYASLDTDQQNTLNGWFSHRGHR